MKNTCVVGCFLLLLSACAGESEEDSPMSEEVVAGIELSGLHWTFSWDLDGIEVDEGSWSTSNEAGVTFTVVSGWLSSYSAALTPCVTEEQDEWANRGLLERLLGIRAAWANHAYDIDPSALAAPILEDLLLLESSDSTPLSFGPTHYCQLHYLVARADPETVDPEPGVRMSLVTLLLNGYWSDGEDSGELQVESSLNYGALFALEDIAASLSGGEARIELRRSASALFSGVEPSAMSEAEVAWKITKNLVDSTELIFDAEDSSSEQ
jgi:hypothetical protein